MSTWVDYMGNLLGNRNKRNNKNVFHTRISANVKRKFKIMASGFFAILDDIAALMDDVAMTSKLATKKTAGIKKFCDK